MAVTCVFGGQWGDEGKGKIVDYLASDADIVVFNPDRKETISANNEFTHHMNVDYSAYEGMEVQGWSEVVLSRGRVICKNGKLETEGGGQFVKRARPLLGREIVVFVRGERNSSALDETDVGQPPPELARDLEGPPARLPRNHVREFVPERGMRVLRTVEIDFTTPRLSDLRVARAHSSFFFTRICEHERCHLGQRRHPERRLQPAEPRCAIAAEPLGGGP